MADHSRFVALAKRLIAKDGDLCTWQKRNGQRHSDVYICFVSQGSNVGITEALGADGSIPRGQYDCLMAPQDFKPEQGDLIVRSDSSQIIVGPIGELKPASETILYYIKFGS